MEAVAEMEVIAPVHRLSSKQEPVVSSILDVETVGDDGGRRWTCLINRSMVVLQWTPRDGVQKERHDQAGIMTAAPKGRGDIHSPANFNPENYEWVGAFDNAITDTVRGDDDQWHTFDVALSDRANELLILLAQSETARYGTGWQCDHCGAHIRYVGVFQHTPTGDHIAVGQVCTDNRFPLSKAEFDRLRKEAQLKREQQRFKVAWEIFRTGHPDVDWGGLGESENGFIIDVLRRGRQYGGISDRQLESIQLALTHDRLRAEREAEEAANPTPRVPTPEGKGIVITGKLVTRKWKDTQWGPTEKCLIVVTDAQGAEWKVWGSVPKGLDAVIGDTVTLTANIERSTDDLSFGFFSRPRKASVVERATEAAA